MQGSNNLGLHVVSGLDWEGYHRWVQHLEAGSPGKTHACYLGDRLRQCEGCLKEYDIFGLPQCADVSVKRVVFDLRTVARCRQLRCFDGVFCLAFKMSTTVSLTHDR